MKWFHEIRDPVHNFIRVTEHERRVINSAPVQRLRHIHQLALAYLLYPGATHRRFEHSLGVMHLAGELFDRLTDPMRVTDQVRDMVDELGQQEHLTYWRTPICREILERTRRDRGFRWETGSRFPRTTRNGAVLHLGP